MKLFKRNEKQMDKEVEKMKFLGNILGVIKGGMNLAAAIINHLMKVIVFIFS
jgi:precorrin isomerase